jgi:predicted MPP superfamily phosphohydrolase
MKVSDREGWSFERHRGPVRERSFFVRNPALTVVLAGLPVAALYGLYEAGTLWSGPDEFFTTPLHVTLYWALWLAWPVGLLFLARVFLRARAGNLLAALVSSLGVLVAGVLIWGHAIEPNRIRTVETAVSKSCGVRVALVSDIRLGVYYRTWQLERLVQRLNELNVDAVLVAGDWVQIPPFDLKSAFAPWTKLRHPTFGVPGNQSERKDGARLKEPLRETLRNAGVEWIDGKRVALGRCELVGLGDLLTGSANKDLRLLQGQHTVPAERRVVLVHHPDAVELLPPNWAGQVLAGHTLGGQVDLPWISEHVLAGRTKGQYARGLYEHANARLFITSGIGLSDWPIRLGVPPTIDVLSL